MPIKQIVNVAKIAAKYSPKRVKQVFELGKNVGVPVGWGSAETVGEAVDAIAYIISGKGDVPGVTITENLGVRS